MLAHKLLNKDEVLDNELRARIMEHLVAKPGSYLGKLSRELDVPTSTLKYHLNILRAFDFITTVKKGRCRHYFPKRRRFSDLEKRMYAAVEHEPTRRIVEIIHRHPGISQGGLVRATGLSQSTVAWHMAKLEEMNLIRSHRNEVKEYYLRGDFEEVLKDMEARGVLGAPASEAVGEDGHMEDDEEAHAVEAMEGEAPSPPAESPVDAREERAPESIAAPVASAQRGASGEPSPEMPRVEGAPHRDESERSGSEESWTRP